MNLMSPANLTQDCLAHGVGCCQTRSQVAPWGKRTSLPKEEFKNIRLRTLPSPPRRLRASSRERMWSPHQPQANVLSLRCLGLIKAIKKCACLHTVDPLIFIRATGSGGGRSKARNNTDFSCFPRCFACPGQSETSAPLCPSAGHGCWVPARLS